MTNKNLAHFIDSDITGTSGLDDWESNNYQFPPLDPTKIQIYTAAQLQAINDNLSGDYEIMNDIDLDGITWTPIGNEANKFTGSLDGRYFTISNLSILKNGDAANINLGLIGYKSGGIVENIQCKNFEISGYRLMGGLCAHYTSDAKFIHCHIDGITITGARLHSGKYLLTYGGGLIGRAEGGVTLTVISKCSAINVNLRSEKFDFCGGLNSTSAHLDNCYATGVFSGWRYSTGESSLVTSFVRCGGCTGSDQTTDTENCYAATFVMPPNVNPAWPGGFGAVKLGSLTYIDCFFDTEVAGTPNGVPNGSDTGLTGKTTVQMYQQATYTNWDFDTIWEIVEGVGYPTHQWITLDPNKIKTGEQHRTTAMPTNHAHLNGQTVQVLGDASYLGTDAVANGEIDLDDNTTVNHVGLGYTSTILPMKLESEVNIKRVSKIVPNVFESVGGNYGRDLADMDSMVLRDANDPLDTDSALFSGTVELPFDGVLDRKGDIYVQQDEPLPFNILGLGIYLSQENI